MKKTLIITFIVIAALLIIYTKFIHKEMIVDYIDTTGIIEVKEVELAPKIPGRIIWLCCKEGEIIKTGASAIRLDDKELKAMVEKGRESLSGAKANLNVSKANLENAKIEIDTVKAEVQSAEAEAARVNILVEDAKKNMERASALFKDGLISEREMDSVKANYDAINAQLDSAKARMSAAESKLKNSITNIKVFEAHLSSEIAKVQEAEASLNLLEIQLKDVEIISPIEGVVVYKAFEEGEMVNTGASVYTIHDFKNIWVRVDIEETMVGRIKLGSKAIVTAPSIPNKEFKGDVIEIGREGEFATQRDVTRGRADIKTFRVKIGVKETNGLLKPGVTAMVRIY
ncbi:MAG: efflux RND transporter periplasmic adaptor subunit [Nitrospinae bacterium]|nr:efflux RND transporter periplasmic adaptor subunit [Nitrospinota bacterium]